MPFPIESFARGDVVTYDAQVSTGGACVLAPGGHRKQYIRRVLWGMEKLRDLQGTSVAFCEGKAKSAQEWQALWR